jgi:predicted GH43/DUF377 family glycosyl hydrolase
MWYTGAAIDLRGRVLLAESADGVTWTRHPVPALDVGATGAGDAWAVDTPAVIQSQGRYLLYYFGQRQAGSVDGGAIGLATSEDGLAFERVGATPVRRRAARADARHRPLVGVEQRTFDI